MHLVSGIKKKPTQFHICHIEQKGGFKKNIWGMGLFC